MDILIALLCAISIVLLLIVIALLLKPELADEIWDGYRPFQRGRKPRRVTAQEMFGPLQTDWQRQKKAEVHDLNERRMAHNRSFHGLPPSLDLAYTHLDEPLKTINKVRKDAGLEPLPTVHSDKPYDQDKDPA